MAAPFGLQLANGPNLKRSFTAATKSTPPPPDKPATFKAEERPARLQADRYLSFLSKRRQASNHHSSNMPVAAGPQAYQNHFPSFMSVYGLDQRGMGSGGATTIDGNSRALAEDARRPPQENENISPNTSPQKHKHNDSTSTQASESTDSSPTTTISTTDSSSLTDPSPSSSPESPITIIPLSSFSATTFGIHSLDDLTMSENVPSDHLKPFGYDRPMTSPSPRKPRNAKGLALNLAPIGDGSAQPQIFSPTSTSPAAFVKPPPPKPRKKPSLLSLQTSTNLNLNAFPRLTLDAPPTPGLSRPMALKHHHSSPLLFSPDPRGVSLPAGGMQLPNFERSAISGLSAAFRKPSALKEATSMGASDIIEEEDLPIRTQMATRSTADIRGDIFDAPPSQEDAVSPGYPDGPVAIYEPYVYLYLEPTAEEASKFDVVVNVASEVKNPFKATTTEDVSRRFDGPKTTFDQPDIDRENMPIPDTAASIATFKTAFEWQPDSQNTPTESSPTTPKPFTKSEPEYIHVPWEHNTDISKELMGLCELIDNRAKEGKKVLVHCQQGASRSASLIIAYGIYKDPNLSVNDAYHAAQAKSKWISPNMKLMYALQDFQKEVEKKKLLSTSGFKRGNGRSPTKHRITLSADAVDRTPQEPLTAPLPDRDGNSPTGTPSRARGNSTPNFGEISPGPSSAPSSFAWTPMVEKGQGQFGLWGSFPMGAGARPLPVASQSDATILTRASSLDQGGDSGSGTRVFSEGGFGTFPRISYDTPPDSAFSSPRNHPLFTFNAFPSLSAAGNPQRDAVTSENDKPYRTQFATKVMDDTPPTPGLWSPRLQEFTVNPLRQSFPYNRQEDNEPPSPDDLMSPRVADFVNPFRPAPPTNFSRPLNTQSIAAVRPIVDPRSPPIKGEAPIIRSIDDVL